MKFTHLIVTKVNLKWLEQSKDPIWLENRIKLLNNILRPSIEAQTNQNFKFITLWGYDPIGQINNEYPLKFDCEGMRPIYNEMVIKLLDYIDEENVLVTRVDSDNALKNDFVEILQKNVNESELPFYYDLKKIDMIHLDTRIKKTWPARDTSAFVSVMEEKSNFKCIPYSTGHGRIQTFVKGIKIDDLLGLCTIHGENVYMKAPLGSISNFNTEDYNLKC